ncbi:hypothetical protein TVAG_453880 [Trichomonas vaginalis G3]|uniref:Sas10 C-terminal domain-containing protein n=1 Tax=Trichomonas vaginalis (strain ATCC PRA-98 / G3) TaxID=412133 RepID=A2DPW4_TRIV3|nr:something about silencing protein 10 family [Trichomonas vaginalis G3]EAY17560.1 hypothetical protein TVAG_453880 [Trichomonas vaginalis G3]KAI5520604.1 something about silencing protein 10 family [Trichomonas vaginalis G3]|eukprot:XP_001329695.1 hypothetical protein [Trichomonas vaginalis G3]
MRSRKNKKSKKGFQQESNKPTSEVPVFQYETNWGKENIYGEADSGSESDEEHYIEEAEIQEKKHLSTLKNEDYKAFQPPSLSEIDHAMEAPKEDSAILEQKLNEKQKEELSLKIKQIISLLVQTTEEIKSDDLEPYQKQLLNSILTNGSFYLYLVSKGYMSTTHPSLDYIEEVQQLLHEGGVEEEEMEEEAEEVAEEEEEPAKEEVPEKHIPDHLQKVEKGEFRPVSTAILKNKVIIPNNSKRRTNPRNAHSHKYAVAMQEYSTTHKKKNAPRDGLYKGERAGIAKNVVRSTKLQAAH